MVSISVVISIYNGELFVSEQLKSILSQTLLPNEIVIINDNSSDKSIKMTRKILNTNIKVLSGEINFEIINNTTNIGSTKSFLKGIKRCHGTHIFLSDQDDIWEKDKIHKMIQKSKNLKPNIPGLVCSDLSLIDNNGNPLNKTYKTEWNINFDHINFNKSLFFNQIPGCSMMINLEMKKALLQFSNNCSYKYHDHLITLLASMHENIVFEDRPLIKWRVHKDQATSKLKSFFPSKLKGLTIPKSYLKEEITYIEDFYLAYRDELNDRQVKIIRQILNYRDSNYLLKRWIFYKTIFNMIK